MDNKKSVTSRFRALISRRKSEFQDKSPQRFGEEAPKSPSPPSGLLKSLIPQLDELIVEISSVSERFIESTSDSSGEGDDLEWHANIRVNHERKLQREPFNVIFDIQGASVERGGAYWWPEEDSDNHKHEDTQSADRKAVISRWDRCTAYINSEFLKHLAKLVAEAELCNLRVNKSHGSVAQGKKRGRTWATESGDAMRAAFYKVVGLADADLIWDGDAVELYCELHNTTNPDEKEREISNFWEVDSTWYARQIGDDYIRGFVVEAARIFEESRLAAVRAYNERIRAESD